MFKGSKDFLHLYSIIDIVLEFYLYQRLLDVKEMHERLCIAFHQFVYLKFLIRFSRDENLRFTKFV